jgi:hypothetical protein
MCFFRDGIVCDRFFSQFPVVIVFFSNPVTSFTIICIFSVRVQIHSQGQIVCRVFFLFVV